MKRLVNVTTGTEVAVYTDELFALDFARVDARRGDLLQLVEVATERTLNGSRIIPGSNISEPIVVLKEVSRTVVREWKYKYKGNR